MGRGSKLRSREKAVSQLESYYKKKQNPKNSARCVVCGDKLIIRKTKELVELLCPTCQTAFISKKKNIFDVLAEYYNQGWNGGRFQKTKIFYRFRGLYPPSSDVYKSGLFSSFWELIETFKKEKLRVVLND